MRKLFFILYICSVSFFTYAQNAILKNYTTSNGLGSNWTYGIVQDKKGFIWISGDKGISRFDGTNFTNYDANDGLPDNQIIRLFKDSKDRIWLSTLNRSVGYIFENKIYTNANSKLFLNIEVKNAGAYLSEDAEGNIYQNIDNGETQFFKFGRNATTKEKVNYKEGFFYSTLQNNGKQYYQLGNGILDIESNTLQKFTNQYKSPTLTPTLFFASDPVNGLSYYIDSIGISLCTPGQNIKNIIDFKSYINHKNIRNLFFTPNNLWVALINGGVYRFSYSKEKGWYNNGLLLKKYDINFVYNDRDNNFWFTTNFNGVVFLPSFYEQINVIDKESGLPNNQCYSIKKHQNILFIGSDDNKIFEIADNKLVKTIQVKKEIEGNSQVYKLLLHNNNLFAGFVNTITKINLQNLADQNIIKTVSKNSMVPQGLALKNFAIMPNGKLFSISGVVDYLETDNPFIHQSVKMVRSGRSYYNYVDTDGNVFVSTNYGLCKLIDSNCIPLNNNIHVLKGKIGAMLQLPNKHYILGNESGLYLFDGASILDSICDKYLLPGLNCRKLINPINTTWALMETGVVEILVVNNKLSIGRRLSLSNGILINAPMDIEEDETNLYIATSSGTYTIDKNIAIGSNVYNSTITGVFSDNVEYTYANSPTIPFSSKPLRISFDMLTFGITDKKEFQYRIVGSNDWITLSGNLVELIELKHGSTTFEIRGRMMGSNWGPSASYEFYYNKPFYRRKGTQFGALIALFAFAFLIYFRRQKKHQQEVLEKHEMKNKISSLENQALENLMHPHFVFNSLNSIQHYINNNDKENANRYLSRFAKLMRLNLNSGINGFITIEDEIERLSLYLSLEQLRFEDKLTYNINCPKNIEIDELYLPSMILQPFIENALWHGILNKGEVGNITITIAENEANNTISIAVIDDGIGIENAKKLTTLKKHKSKGLLLINTRLQVLSEKYEKPFTITNEIPDILNKNFPGHKVVLNMPTLYQEDVNK